MSRTRIIGVVLAASLLAACAADDPNRSAKRGAVVGAIVGAVIGNQGGDDRDRYLGAAVGALGGAAVGGYMDRQRAELERQLADEQRREALEITEIGDNALRIGVASDATFAFDRAEIQDQFKPTYAKIANVLSDYERTIIHVVGHTDSVGSETYNLGLSRRRAESVGLYLRSQGVSGDRLIYEGRGESEPLAGNDTAEGRRRNRRVDIVVKPIVEGEERRAYAPPPYLGG